MVSANFGLHTGGKHLRDKGKKMMGFLSTANKADLQYIAKLAEEDKLLSVIEKTFTLDDAADALRAMGKGGLTGKLVVTI